MALTRPSGPTADPAERQHNPKLFEVLDEYADAIEGGGPTTNYDLAKARDVPLVKERSQTVTLDTGQAQIHDFQMAEGKLYGTTRTTPSWFIRFNNLEDLTDRTAFQFAADGFHDQGEGLIYIPEKGKLYVLFTNASRILVSEVDPVTHVVTDVINDTSRVAGTNPDLVSDGTHLYVTTYASPSKVVKYRLSDFAFVAETTLTGLNQAHCAIYDGTDIYVGATASPTWVAKVNPTDLSFTSVTFPTGISNISHPGLTSVGDYLYAAMEGAPGAGLWRINKADLSLTVIPGVPGTCHAVLYDGRYVWATQNTSPGKVTRVDPNDIDSLSVHTFDSGENHAYAMASDGQRIFIVFWLPNPAKVKRFVPAPGGSPSPGPSVKTLNVTHVAVGNVGTGEDTLLSYAVIGTLGADGKAIRVTASGSFAANANAKRLILKFGLGSPVVVFDTGSLLFNDARWWLDALCIRTSEDNQKWVCRWTSDSSLLATKVTPPVLTTQNDGGTLNILVRGVGVADNDVVNETLLVETIN